jgi:spore maturation protein CgeB
MKLVVFGLAVSSSWGNGHATLWRGLCRALAARGHFVVFFERDVPYYASHRDVWELPGGSLVLYPSWPDVRDIAVREINSADAAIVTSFCPDAAEAERLVLDSRVARRVFYDLDTPVTLDRLARGEAVPYIGPRGLIDYDLVLSYTGGASLDALRERLGAHVAVPLYGSVDPEAHQPTSSIDMFRADLSYLGTYAADRQATLERLFHGPAWRLPERRFVLGGSQYPVDFPWSPNIFYMRHVAPYLHAAFYCSSRVTLNVTRAAMAATGYCPSGRLFEAAACGVPVLSDAWPGLEQFFEPDREILVAETTEDVVASLERSDAELQDVARCARERTLTEHTADRRAEELETLLEQGASLRGRDPGVLDRGRDPGVRDRGRDPGVVDRRKDHHVGDYSGGGSGDADSAARVF